MCVFEQEPEICGHRTSCIRVLLFVCVSHMLPGDALSVVFALFLSEDQLNEKLLQLLVAVVNAELFETVQQQRNKHLSNIINND